MTALADYYRGFSEVEARGVSPVYDEWALGVAGDPEILALLERLPGLKAQANLVFAAARWHGCPLGDFAEFRRWLLAHWAITRATILARSTQTNEAGRCATLLPELAAIDGPIALLEVGASAGLCLYPDRYSYRYEQGGAVTKLDPIGGESAVVLPCEVGEGIAVPTRLPDVVWRAGIDLDPIDAGDPDAEKWLETLVWPGEQQRVPRLRSAAAIVASARPRLVKGDLLESLHSTIAEAPTEATLVVFHSAVLVYANQDHRRDFVDTIQGLDCVWLSNEGGSVLPEVRAQLPPDLQLGRRFVLARDGVAVALTGPHGQSIEAVPS